MGNALERLKGYLQASKERGFLEMLSGSQGARSLFGRLSKGLWAVADQGLFAVSNFVLNVLLARWLSQSDYGAFALAFAIFLLVGTFHNATFTEPMLVFGSGRYKDRLPEYLGTLLYGHLGFAVLSGTLLLVVSLGAQLLGSNSFSTVLAALALAGPFIFFLWLMRRACYIRLQPSLAAWGGAFYMVLMMSGTYVVYRLGWLSAAAALGIMGVSSLVVGCWLAVRLRVRRPSLRRDGLARRALDSHWNYGRWSVWNQVLTWAPQNTFYLLLPVWGGLEASASLRALMNLIMPVLQANSSLSTLLLPALVRARGSIRFSALVRFALTTFVAGSLLYWLLLGLFHEQAMTLLYGGKYGQNADLLWLVGLLPVSAGVMSVYAAALRSCERPDLMLRATALSAAIVLTFGIIAMFAWGVAGAVVGLLFASVAAAGTAAYLSIVLRRSWHRGEGSGARNPDKDAQTPER